MSLEDKRAILEVIAQYSYTYDARSLRADLANFFVAVVRAERSMTLPTCAVFISVSWCPNVAPPNTY